MKSESNGPQQDLGAVRRRRHPHPAPADHHGRHESVSDAEGPPAGHPGARRRLGLRQDQPPNGRRRRTRLRLCLLRKRAGAVQRWPARRHRDDAGPHRRALVAEVHQLLHEVHVRVESAGQKGELRRIPHRHDEHFAHRQIVFYGREGGVCEVR